MEELEGFLMQDEYGEDFWPANITTADIHDINPSFFESWVVDLPETNGFESDLFSLLEEDEYGVQECLVTGSIINGDENQNNLNPTHFFHQEQPEQNQEQILVLQKQQEQEQVEEQQENEDEVDEDESDDKKNDGNNSKNLFSERNRRKRLNSQLFTLRSLVPNITKMDKRSILVDALAYLQSILQQIERESMERSNLSSDSNILTSSCEDIFSLLIEEKTPSIQTQGYDPYASLPAISEIDAEMLDEDRYVVKIGCNKARGGLRLVQRAIEMLGLEISCISINDLDQAHLLTTTFLRVKKKGVLTQEKLIHRMKTNASKLGLPLPTDL